MLCCGAAEVKRPTNEWNVVDEMLSLVVENVMRVIGRSVQRTNQGGRKAHGWQWYDGST
jgi:hypothetical protein